MASGILAPLLEVTMARGGGPSDIFHQRPNTCLSSKAVCFYLPLGNGCCVSLVEQAVPGCSEDLSCGSPLCRASSGFWLGHTGRNSLHLTCCPAACSRRWGFLSLCAASRGFCFPHLAGKPRVPRRHHTCRVLQGNIAILEKQKHIHPTAGKEQGARDFRVWREVMGCIPAVQHESHRT